MTTDQGRLFFGCCFLIMACALAFLAWEVRQSRLMIAGAIVEMRQASHAAAEKARAVAAGIDKVQDATEKVRSASERARELWKEVK
jgi:hypothetical protein